MPKVKLGESEIQVGEFSARKAIRVMKIIRQISQGWPQIANAMERFVRDYEQENWLELDRSTALFQYGPQPLEDDEGGYVRDENGHVLYGPSRLAHMSDEDWEKSGQKLRLPRSPMQYEVAWHVFPLAFDLAEDLMLQLCALVVIDNQKLGRTARDGGAEAVTELLRERGEELLDEALGDELLELLVTASEVVGEQFASKVRELGDQVGKLIRLLGLRQGAIPAETTETSTSTSGKPSSSTDSDPPTAGERSEPSTAPAGDSSLTLVES